MRACVASESERPSCARRAVTRRSPRPRSTARQPCFRHSALPVRGGFLVNFDLSTGIAGLLVGAIVGITGVGGGALMTPILVLLFGVAPTTAVGTDLLYASVTKVFGTAVHHKHGT